MSDFLKKIISQISDIKRKDPKADVSDIIKDALETRQDKEEIMGLLSLLASEYHLFNKLDEAEKVINERIALEPNLPDGWLSLAGHFHYYVHDLPKAYSIIEVAVEKALKDGNFVRQAYCMRIRIALDMKNYKAIEDSLGKLIKYHPKPGSIDVNYEDDFVKRIPMGEINSNILEEYKKLSGVNKK